MKYQLFNEFKTNYGIASIISPKALICYWISVILLFVDFILMVYFFINIPYLFLKIVVVLFGFGLILIVFLVSRNVQIHLINTKYNTAISEKFWRFNCREITVEVMKQKKCKMNEYLEIHKLDDTGKLQHLIEAYQKDAESLKLNIAPAPAIFAALFIPLWSSFLTWLFDKFTSINESVLIFLVGFVLSIAFTALLMALRDGQWTPIEEWITSDRQKYLALCRMLESIKMDIDLKK